MGFGLSSGAQIINIVARTFYAVCEIRNPAEFSSALLTKALREGSASSEVKGGFYSRGQAAQLGCAHPVCGAGAGDTGTL